MDDPLPPARAIIASGATFIVTLVLLAMAFWLTRMVLLMPTVPDVLVSAIVTAWITLPLGGVTGFWLGSSVGSRAK
jgi:hypothetical protein